MGMYFVLWSFAPAQVRAILSVSNIGGKSHVMFGQHVMFGLHLRFIFYTYRSGAVRPKC